MNGYDAYGPLNISAESLANEAMQAQGKLRAGLDTLREVDDVEYGATAKEEVWRDGKVVLYRFRGEQTPTARVPLLIAYALVNRPYMVDLQADKSIVRGLLERGEDVYVLDWGYPDRSDRYLELDDYIQRFLGGAVDHLRSAYRLDSINLLGICQGGAFSLCYAALNPAKVRNLITMVTPVDFHTPDNMLSNWVRELDADLFVDTLGNVPADVMNWCYLTLKPWRLFVQKYVGLVDILDNKQALEDFLRMEKWIFDSPDQAGEAFRQFIKQFYQGNGFVKGGIDIGGRPVDLRHIVAPVLNIYAEQDHLVPPDASRALAKLVGTTDYSELSFRGGHIGIYVSSRAQREVPQSIHDWLTRRSR
ncbi:class III poly(R)-hydroxyalkanoic acid synthase subunit PhaC [Montanilutibacter psychrotolerans]|uniref:Poly(3-hydroxyalkanoate) polymerase subunit PhaC n=1 Tax=Montanilutibacter psychrotolerans TaxID=1327343 RepID=A0A3M8T149_9GAMM|nr:class III poly(R)-hydroxyalkanoic acid synthase subunit PhaC [Lysobacter psychrotolerans]RNF85254.1 class III poly(R)-hydroxyalkanoic acid synthase subunit PhaC [Lysobacter psychrotolerans]